MEMLRGFLILFWSYNNLDLHFMDIYFLVFITFNENGNKDNDKKYSYRQKPHYIILVYLVLHTNKM